ncbi:MAG: aldose 1-epimerase [Deltaproteobacteria bacterium]
MPLLRLQNDALRLEVLPEAGASIVTLAIRREGRWVPLMRATPREAIAQLDSSAMAAFVLAPFSNRLTDARFHFAGKTWQLEANFTGGYAIHGCVRQQPWEVVACSDEKIRLGFDSAALPDPGFPFPFAATLTYTVHADTMTARIELMNRGTGPMPAGFGFHPYYERTLLDPNEKVELQMRTTGAYTSLAPQEAARPLVPEQDFTERRALPSAGFDTCFTGWDGHAELHWPGSGVTAAIDCDKPLRHMVLFTPPGESFFALEPVSNANNGFNLLADGIDGSGVVVLEAGATMAANFRVHVR